MENIKLNVTDTDAGTVDGYGGDTLQRFGIVSTVPVFFNIFGDDDDLKYSGTGAGKGCGRGNIYNDGTNDESYSSAAGFTGCDGTGYGNGEDLSKWRSLTQHYAPIMQ